MFHRQGRWQPRDLNELRKVAPGHLTPDLCFLIATSWLRSKQTKYRERRDLCLTENSFKVMILCFLRLSEWWCQRERRRREVLLSFSSRIQCLALGDCNCKFSTRKLETSLSSFTWDPFLLLPFRFRGATCFGNSGAWPPAPLHPRGCQNSLFFDTHFQKRKILTDYL